jgi:putative effector of murein hydrolase LrgA (UPF0299 family)
MQQQWFKKNGWVYFPCHTMGYIVSFLAILFMIPVCIAVMRNSHSVSDDLYEIFVFGTCTAFWWKWVAEKTS